MREKRLRSSLRVSSRLVRGSSCTSVIAASGDLSAGPVPRAYFSPRGRFVETSDDVIKRVLVNGSQSVNLNLQLVMVDSIGGRRLSCRRFLPLALALLLAGRNIRGFDARHRRRLFRSRALLALRWALGVRRARSTFGAARCRGDGTRSIFRTGRSRARSWSGTWGPFRIIRLWVGGFLGT